jgi:hypothetical protein
VAAPPERRRRRHPPASRTKRAAAVPRVGANRRREEISLRRCLFVPCSIQLADDNVNTYISDANADFDLQQVATMSWDLRFVSVHPVRIHMFKAHVFAALAGDCDLFFARRCQKRDTVRLVLGIAGHGPRLDEFKVLLTVIVKDNVVDLSHGVADDGMAVGRIVHHDGATIG